MLRLMDNPPSPEQLFAAFRLYQQLKLLVPALLVVVTHPDRLTLSILVTSAANAVLVVGYWRAARPARLHTAYLLLSWTGHSFETAYYLYYIIRSTGLHGWLFLASVALALFACVAHWLSIRFIIRRTTWTFLLLIVNRAVQAVWYTREVWRAMRTSGFLLSTLGIAGAVVLAILPLALYMPMCALQDCISSRSLRRARGRTRSAAADLPAEVQLIVFHPLRTRGRSGAHEHLARDTEFDRDTDLIPFSGAGDLAAAARVCTAWRTAATEALYRDAVLLSGKPTRAFSRALEARPALAPLVRRIFLPEWSKYTPRERGTEGHEKKTSFAAAIQHIVACCENATDIRLFRDRTPLLPEIPGLRAASSRVSHLHIQSGIPERWPSYGTIHEPEDLDVLLLLSFLPRLESLTLTRQRVVFDGTALDHAQRGALRGIRALSLGACVLDMQQLVRLLLHLPNLRTTELRNTVFSDTGGGPVTVSELFTTQQRTLGDLSLLVDDALPTRIIFGSFGAFVALRVLTVNAHMLSAIVVLPPSLQTLIVSFAPYSCHSLCRTDYSLRSMLSAVRDVRCLAAGSPTLRAVQLWDDVHLTQLAHWAVASFMLREMLARARIELDVNLFVAMRDNLMLKDKFSTRKVMRRILWQGVV